MHTPVVARIKEYGRSVEFDAEPFFRHASAEQVGAILKEIDAGTYGWNTHGIVRHMADKPGYEGLHELHDMSIGHDIGIVCEIRREDVRAWLDLKQAAAGSLQGLFDAAAERVGHAFEEGMLTRSSFHLSACGGCGGPSFGQPCALCGFYPYGTPTAADRAPPATRDGFARSLQGSMPNGAGNVATWYLASYRRTVAYKESISFRDRLDRAIAKAAGMSDLPSPTAVFDHVASGGRITRPPAGSGAYDLWTAMGELDMAVHQGTRGASHARELELVHSLSRAAEAAKGDAVAAIHSGEGMAEATDGLAQAVDGFVNLSPRPNWVPLGNLAHARRLLAAIRQEHEPAAPAP